jgi:hypothetical protein
MSIFKDKTLKSVAEAAAKIMAQESSHGTHPKTEKEKSLAALAHPKDKITHKDVLVGRGVLKKEEVEQIDELSTSTLSSYVKKRGLQLRGGSGDTKKIKGINLAMKKMTKEETERVNEGDTYDYDRYKVHNGKATLHNPAKGEKDEPHHIWAESPAHALEKFKKKSMKEELTAWQKVQRKKEEMEDKRRERMEREDMPEPEKKKPTTQKVAGHRYGGSKQKDETNEETLPFTQMLESYTERGLKALSGMIREEPDNEQWTKELKDQEATAAGKKKPASVAAPSTMGVKTMKEDEELTLEDFTPEEIEEFMQSEEYEQLDELSKGTLGSYIRKAANKIGQHAYDAGEHAVRGNLARSEYHQKKEFKRTEGIRRASRKMEEDVEVIDFTDVNNVQKYTIKDEDIQQERALTEPEMEKKEKIVKGMKKGLEGFKQRYGERAKSVLYATATSMAKKDK